MTLVLTDKPVNIFFGEGKVMIDERQPNKHKTINIK